MTLSVEDAVSGSFGAGAFVKHFTLLLIVVLVVRCVADAQSMQTAEEGQYESRTH